MQKDLRQYLFILITIYCLSPFSLFADTYSYNLSDGNMYIWDLSGNYSDHLFGMDVSYDINHDEKGKLAGSVDISGYDVKDGLQVKMTLNVKGTVKQKKDVTTVKMSLTGKGTAGDNSNQYKLSYSKKITGTINPDSLTIEGEATEKVSIKKFNSYKETFDISIPLPAGMDGSSILSIEVNEEGKKLVGAGTLELSNSRTFNFDTVGKYNSKKNTTKLNLKGNGCKIKPDIGNDSIMLSIKGKVLGQSIIGSNLEINIPEAMGTIGPEGGTIEFPEGSLYKGTGLVIPVGALSESTEISISVVEQPNSPEGAVTFELEPEKLTFGVPATLTLQYSQNYLDDHGIQATELEMYLQNSQTGEWELLDAHTNQAENTLSADIAHFSDAKVTTAINYLLYTQERTLIDGTPTAVLIRDPDDPDHPISPEFGTTTQLVNNIDSIFVSLGRGSLDDFFAGTGRNLLLVHGILANAGTFLYSGGTENFNDLVHSLEFEYDNIILYNYPTADPIDENAEGLRKAILDAPRLDPSFQTDIIAHSMGGLVSRYTIEKLGLAPYVSNLIMLGTPNSGSPFADTYATFLWLVTPYMDTYYFPSALQMRPGSFFIHDLNSTDQSTIDTNYYVIAGDIGDGSDSYVTTVSATSIIESEDCKEIIDGVKHGALHTEAQTNGVIDHIYDWLNFGSSESRFTDMGDGTVRDNRSGLFWLKDANAFGSCSLSAANQYVKNLEHGQCGLTDGSTKGQWRLPTIREWEEFVDTNYRNPALSSAAGDGQWIEGDPFLQVVCNNPHAEYWSSEEVECGPDACFCDGVLNIYYGYVGFESHNGQPYVWPVRAGH